MAVLVELVAAAVRNLVEMLEQMVAMVAQLLLVLRHHGAEEEAVNKEESRLRLAWPRLAARVMELLETVEIAVKMVEMGHLHWVGIKMVLE